MSHVVRPARTAVFATPSGWASGATGYRRWTGVDEGDGAVHTGFGICDLEAGGAVPAHLHSFEETFYVEHGTGVLDTAEGSIEVGPGDYGLLPVGVPHAWRNLSIGPCDGPRCRVRRRAGTCPTTRCWPNRWRRGIPGRSTCGRRATGGSAPSPATT